MIPPLNANKSVHPFFNGLLSNLLFLFSMTLIGAAFAESKSLPEFIPIPAGSFVMGADLSYDYINAGPALQWRSIFIQDEFPARTVHITMPFAIAKHEITNIQYEQFDPGHREWRGKFMELSTGDDEAVIYVSWHDAEAYCRWLSEQDDRYDYRLPTEAEWEYVTRAGTRTSYSNGETGDIYALNPYSLSLVERMNYTIFEEGELRYPFTYSNGCRSWVPWRPQPCAGVEDAYPGNQAVQDADLTVGHQGPNAFGIYDLHGGVEEWILDWYGPYVQSDTIDPVGYTTGTFRGVRGGSHNNHVQYARSANRGGAAPADKHFLLGFRVVRVAKGHSLPQPSLTQPQRPWQELTAESSFDWPADSETPVFNKVSLYDRVPRNEDGSHYGSEVQLRQFGFDPDKQEPLLTGPLYSHNHSSAITWAENGDILVSWFSGESEVGTELTLLACRGQRQFDGSLQWTPASEFFKAPDRNMHGTMLQNNTRRIAAGLDSEFTLYQVASIGTDGRWAKLVPGFRTSTDHGRTWSPVRILGDGLHNRSAGTQMQGNSLVTSDGTLLFTADDHNRTSSLLASSDGGRTWETRGHSDSTPRDQRIIGIHANVVEIADVDGDGRTDLMALGRDGGDTFGGVLPRSISTDRGHTWRHEPTDLPSVDTGQRVALIRLPYSTSHDRQPLLLAGFGPLQAKDTHGQVTTVEGLYVALSFDNGRTWPAQHRRVVSDESGPLIIAPWQRSYELTRTTGQGEGYLSATQTPDGLIYLTDGKIVYSFNLAWVME